MSAEQAAHAAALAALDLSAARLRRILAEHDPVSVWAAIRRGSRSLDPTGRLQGQAQPEAPAAMAATLAARSVVVSVIGRAGFPACLAEDPDGPAVVFSLGDLTSLARRPAVAIVGSWAATRYGREFAAELGEELAPAGVVVVSGLAREHRRRRPRWRAQRHRSSCRIQRRARRA